MGLDVLAHARARLLRRGLDRPLLAVNHRRHARRALEAGGLHRDGCGVLFPSAALA